MTKYYNSIEATGGGEQEMTRTPWKFDDNHGCRRIKGGKMGRGKQAQYQQVAYTTGVYDDDKDRANAAGIVSAVNGTWGVGVNPEAVKDLHHALNSLVLSVMAHPDYTGEENEEWTDLVEMAQDALNKSKIAKP